jgi:hypothetical protein
MGAMTDGSQAIKCWNPDGAGEIPVGRTAGRSLAQLAAELGRHGGGPVVQVCDPRRALERRAVDAT